MYKDILWNVLYRNAQYMCIILVAKIMTILTALFIGTLWPPNRTFTAQKMVKRNSLGAKAILIISNFKFSYQPENANFVQTTVEIPGEFLC